MNEYFGIGKVIRKENFKFVLNKNHKSRIAMTIKLIDANEVQIVAYDEKADYMIRNIFEGDVILIQGKLKSENNILIIEVKYVEKI